jgi:hypothetical protein
MKECASCLYVKVDGTQQPCISCDSNASHWVAMPNYNPEDVAFTKTTAGVKYDNGKPQWSLLPFRALTQVVEVLTYGAKKYAPDNWKRVPDARRRYIDAGFRHLTAYTTGETNDPETGKHHLAHAICCLLYLVAFDLGEHNDKSNSDV